MACRHPDQAARAGWTAAQKVKNEEEMKKVSAARDRLLEYIQRRGNRAIPFQTYLHLLHCSAMIGT